ncbi:hypothetical protein [Aurantiacibacter odishensis]|uniref:hypothetical protein n=1 Tax=Aurantiacibacter odishensis TaxID=1155476 RepID=UPI000E75A95E|nr:hypothetical protein [Aurantiacibacter odishensis]
MKKLLIALPIIALAACAEPAPEPAPVETATPEPTPSAPAPDQALFSELYAAACPDNEAVNESICQRAMGADTASCEFSLGDDEYLRNDATLELDETGEAWVLADAEAVCTQ